MFTRPIAASPVASTLFAQEVPKLVLPPLVPSYPGHALAQAALASGNGQTADLDGPAAGYIRIYDQVSIVASALASGLTNVTVALRSGGTDYLIMAATTSTATINLSAVPALANGETLRITNGGNNAGKVQGTYVDIPATGITVVRTALDNTGVEVIPASPTGYTSRFLQHDAAAPVVVCSNRDAVDQSFECLVDGTLVSRSAPASAGAVTSLAQPTLFHTASQVKVKLTAAVDTTTPVILCAYELLPA